MNHLPSSLFLPTHMADSLVFSFIIIQKLGILFYLSHVNQLAPVFYVTIVRVVSFHFVVTNSGEWKFLSTLIALIEILFFDYSSRS